MRWRSRDRVVPASPEGVLHARRAWRRAAAPRAEARAQCLREARSESCDGASKGESLGPGLVGGGPIDRRQLATRQAEIHRELPSVVDLIEEQEPAKWQPLPRAHRLGRGWERYRP